MILAIDTSLGAVSACVLECGANDVVAVVSQKMARGHAEALAPALAELLRDVPGGVEALNRVAVTIGPGSFTGVRVGVAAARAVGLVRNIDVVGVSTLSAFSAPLLGVSGAIVVSGVDGRNGAIIAEGCDDGGALLFSGQYASAGDLLSQAGAAPLRLAGPAAPRIALEAWARGLPAEVVGETDCPDIVYVAMLGRLADMHESPPRPVYVSSEGQGGDANGHIPV